MNEKVRGNIVVVGMALTPVLLLAICASIIFRINPDAEQNRTEISGVGLAVHEVICAQAQSTANAYRARTLTPSGEIEPAAHFITRLLAQAQTLRLAQGLGCKSAPGFPAFDIQVNRALREISDLLAHFPQAQRHATKAPLSDRAPVPSLLFPALGGSTFMPTAKDGGSDESGLGQGSPTGTPTKPPKVGQAHGDPGHAGGGQGTNGGGAPAPSSPGGAPATTPQPQEEEPLNVPGIIEEVAPGLCASTAKIVKPIGEAVANSTGLPIEHFNCP